MSRLRSTRFTRNIVVIVRGLVMLLALFGSVRETHAHELGLTRVAVTFSADRRYAIEIPVDPETVLAKLELLAGQSPSGTVPIDELAARIHALSPIFLARTRVLFDGMRQEPEIEYIANPPPSALGLTPADGGVPLQPGAPPTAPTALVRLTGVVPRGARQFQFHYGLVIGSYALSLRSDVNGQAEAPPITLWVAGGADSDPIDLSRGLVPPSRLAIAAQYFVLGFEHILPKGLDHILFVLGIFLLSAAWRPVLLQVTTFTIAHSITLGLTIYGVVSLPPTIVEPLIAASITYVALENLFTSTLQPWRLVLVFLFGLLHGMGFAGVLRELGLPRSEFLTALLTFNVGVEAGQLTVIALALLAVGWWRRADAGLYRRWVVIPASILIALVGAWWTVERTLLG